MEQANKSEYENWKDGIDRLWQGIYIFENMNKQELIDNITKWG